MERRREIKGKIGYTTGTCAAAAAKAATLMLFSQRQVGDIRVETPAGIPFTLSLCDSWVEKTKSGCGVVKDAGDDPDVTNGTKIYAEVRFSPRKGIVIKGGEGVGKVTKPGLAACVGEYAINPVPRKMIIKEVSRYLPKDRGLEVVISAPQGEELAKHTFNPRLGVVGGISILGTTGIVEPKSGDAYKTSLSLQLDVLKAQGYERATLVLGYVGEKFGKERLKLQPDSIIKIGDHIGYILKECAKKKIKEVLLIGHIGKLVKIVSGQFNTHYQFGDNRVGSIAHYAKLAGAPRDIIEEILKQATAEATIEILRKSNFMKTFDEIAKKVVEKAKEFVSNELKINCILLSLKGEVLGGAG